MRLQRYLALCGVASRRSAETLITGGRVAVNGHVVRELGSTVDPQHDRVEYDGAAVALPAEPHYVVLHKPFGVMTTMCDPEGRRTVADLVARNGITARVVPVGRLDYDTAGVLLLTDDGAMAHVLTHPSFGVEKTYRATVRGRLSPADVEALGEGVRLEDGPAQPAVIRVVAVRAARSTVDITIHEGRNRQVRRMFERLSHPVVDLVRLRFGPISLGALAPGSVRPVSERELRDLRAIVAAAQ